MKGEREGTVRKGKRGESVGRVEEGQGRERGEGGNELAGRRMTYCTGRGLYTKSQQRVQSSADGYFRPELYTD